MRAEAVLVRVLFWCLEGCNRHFDDVLLVYSPEHREIDKRYLHQYISASRQCSR